MTFVSLNVHPERWEHGSEFSWVDFEPQPAVLEGTFFAAGRDALRALARLLKAKGSERWHVPAYFCPEVVDAILEEAKDVVGYADDPSDPSAPIGNVDAVVGDVVLVVNTLGLRSPSAWKALAGVTLVEDHTHDPWSTWAEQSTADYCVVSYRKTLPVTDGAIVRSPTGQPLPSEPEQTAERRAATADKLAAMLLKRLYLQGGSANKATYRELQRRGEAAIASGDPSGGSALGRSLIASFPWESWRLARSRNHTMFADMLAEVRGVSVLNAQADSGSCPFSLVLTLPDNGQRESLQQHLIAQGVYPAVLWSIPNDAAWSRRKSRELGARMLSLHCDGRYGPNSIARVANIVKRWANLRAHG